MVEEEILMSINKVKQQLDNDKVVFKSEISQSKDFPAKIIEMAKLYEADLIILTANLDHDSRHILSGHLYNKL